MHPDASPEYAFGPYRLRADERALRVGARRIALAPKVCDTLLVLLEAGDRVVSKEELMERVWPDAFVDEANLTQNIYVLRKTFALAPGGPRIENVPKRGYRLVVPPSAAAAPSAPPHSRRNALARAITVALACVALLGRSGLPHGEDAPPACGGADPYRLPSRALQSYLLGRFNLNRGTASGLQRSLASFGAVAETCPASPLGYAGLADALTSLTFRTVDAEARTRIGARAIAFANEAVARGSGSADAYAALGAVRASVEHDDAAAARAFAVALRLDPRNLDALVWYGTELMNGGEVAAARRLFARAVAVDPTAPGPIASLAWADFLERDYAEAAAFAQQLLRARRLQSLALLTLAASYIEMRDYERALPAATALGREPGMATQSAAFVAQIDALRGARERARRALAKIEASTDPERIGAWDVLALAAADARAGRAGAALVWLARIRSSERRQLARDPRFDVLRTDRRFEGWLRG